MMDTAELRALSGLVSLAISEDLGQAGDLTSKLIFGKEKATARMVVKEPVVVCGLDAISKTYARIDKQVKIKFHVKDGAAVGKEKAIATITGQAISVLSGERIALNFVQRLSGIASITNEFRRKTRKVKIYDTRKTTPGWRLLEKYAVRMGGGSNHRLSLSDMILVKTPHILGAGSVDEALARVFKTKPKKKVQVEIRNLSELRYALAYPIDSVMLDNMNPSHIKKAIDVCRSLRKTVKVELSGGITLSNLNSYVRAHPDRISIGMLTHSAPSKDMHFSYKFVG